MVVFETFDEYWEPIETGVGMLPHAYAPLTETDLRRAAAMWSDGFVDTTAEPGCSSASLSSSPLDAAEPDRTTRVDHLEANDDRPHSAWRSTNGDVSTRRHVFEDGRIWDDPIVPGYGQGSVRCRCGGAVSPDGSRSAALASCSRDSRRR
jgi:hypothetical protein